MISNRIVAIALLLVCGVTFGGAKEDSFDPAAVYYQRNLKDSPQGVYEWPEQGLLFVQVHVPCPKELRERIDGLVLLAQQRELFRWLVRKTDVGKRLEEDCSRGVQRVRDLVRRHYPEWGLGVDWAYDFSGQSFTREEDGKRVACAVCSKTAVEQSWPKDFDKPIGDEVWLAGLKHLIADRYLPRCDLPLMAYMGFFDGVEVCGTKKDRFLLEDKDSVVYSEYQAVTKELKEYLRSSEAIGCFKTALAQLEHIAPKESFAYVVPPDVFTTNVVVVVQTNVLKTTAAVTNIVEIDAKGISPVMPRGGVLRATAVTHDDSVVTTIETMTIVRSRKTLVKRTETAYVAEPEFERSFLSGGGRPLRELARTQIGREAEKFFYKKCTRAERTRRVLDALRENPGDKVLWNLYGRLLQQEKDWLGALICFRNSLRLDYCYQYALVNLAQVYRELGKVELSYAAAAIAYGVAEDEWCVRQAKGLLLQ